MTKYITIGDFESGTFHYLIGDELVADSDVLELSEAVEPCSDENDS